MNEKTCFVCGERYVPTITNPTKCSDCTRQYGSGLTTYADVAKQAQPDVEPTVYVVMTDCRCRKCIKVQATCLGVYTTREAAEGVAGAGLVGGYIKVEEHILEDD